MAKKGGLGKGLDAIFHDNARSDDSGAVELSINEIEPNRAQPRKTFSDEAMRELAESISQHGVLQPLLVRPQLSGGYQIVQALGMPSSYSDLVMILPYVLTLLLLVFFSKHNDSPRALGEIYDKGKR